MKTAFTVPEFPSVTLASEMASVGGAGGAQGGRLTGFELLSHGLRTNWNMLVDESMAVTFTGSSFTPSSTWTRVTLLAEKGVSLIQLWPSPWMKRMGLAKVLAALTKGVKKVLRLPPGPAWAQITAPRTLEAFCCSC